MLFLLLLLLLLPDLLLLILPLSSTILRRNIEEMETEPQNPVTKQFTPFVGVGEWLLAIHPLLLLLLLLLCSLLLLQLLLLLLPPLLCTQEINLHNNNCVFGANFRK